MITHRSIEQELHFFANIQFQSVFKYNKLKICTNPEMFAAGSWDIGQCLHKSLPHLTKVVKADAISMTEERMAPTLYGM